MSQRNYIYPHYHVGEDVEQPAGTELYSLPHDKDALQFSDTLQATSLTEVTLIHENQATGEFMFTDYEVTIL